MICPIITANEEGREDGRGERGHTTQQTRWVAQGGRKGQGGRARWADGGGKWEGGIRGKCGEVECVPLYRSARYWHNEHKGKAGGHAYQGTTKVAINASAMMRRVCCIGYLAGEMKCHSRKAKACVLCVSCACRVRVMRTSYFERARACGVGVVNGGKGVGGGVV